GLDALVANAGIPCRVPAPELTAERVVRVLDVDFHAPAAMSLALLPAMLEVVALHRVRDALGELPCRHLLHREQRRMVVRLVPDLRVALGIGSRPPRLETSTS
ncbi:MAG: SDR family NAD(P)-dependent oxidoreductase, partial [Thermodesulfobacteriota bacterium]